MAVRHLTSVDTAERDLRVTVDRIRLGEVHDRDRALKELLDAAERLLEIRAGEEFVPTGSAAEQLGIASINTIKNWIRQGVLDGRVVHGRYHVAQQSIDRLLASASQDIENERAEYRRLRALQLMDTLDASHEEAAPQLVRDRDLGDEK